MMLNGKTAIVTGGSAGIGRAIAEDFASLGARVIVCGRSPDKLEAAVSEMQGGGGTVEGYVCDVSDLEQVEDFLKRALSEEEEVHILVNNAGTLVSTPLENPRDEDWSLVLKTNLDGPYFFTTRLLKHLADGGRIVNISSVLGKFGVPGSTAYCAAKHGIIGFTRAAALELAPRKITVNAVCPGWVETDLAKQVMVDLARAQGRDYEQVREESIGRVPLQEMIEPEEVAALVRFLVSPQARNVTGQAYNLCGGQVMH